MTTTRERLRALADAYANDVTMAPDALTLAAYRMALEDAARLADEWDRLRVRPLNGTLAAAVRALAEGLA